MNESRKSNGISTLITEEPQIQDIRYLDFSKVSGKTTPEILVDKLKNVGTGFWHN